MLMVSRCHLLFHCTVGTDSPSFSSQKISEILNGHAGSAPAVPADAAPASFHSYCVAESLSRLRNQDSKGNKCDCTCPAVASGG